MVAYISLYISPHTHTHTHAYTPNIHACMHTRSYILTHIDRDVTSIEAGRTVPFFYLVFTILSYAGLHSLQIPSCNLTYMYLYVTYMYMYM